MKLFKIWMVGLVVLSSSLISFGQSCMMTPISLNERVTQSDLVIEGKIIGQKAFFNNNNTAIYTINKIEVYKVFKGNLNSNIISVVTAGGQVGMQMHKVSPSLGLIPGEVGVLTLETSGITLNNYDPNFLNNGTIAPANEILYLPYASAQGFINYDRNEKKAIGIFDSYTEVLNDLYIALHTITGRGYVEIKAFNAHDYLNQLEGGVRAPLTITSILNSFNGTNIAAAGCYQEITITGTGFGATQGQIIFRRADDGGVTTINCPPGLIQTWIDGQIRVFVPEGATTGNVQVKNTTGGANTFPLTVPYNISNVGSSGIENAADLVNQNGIGGYTWTYNSNFYNNKPAVARYAEALCAWTGVSEINWDTSATRSTIACEAQGDGVNIVTFDNTCGLPAGVLGTCYSYYSGCYGASGLSWYVSDMDIKFDAGQNWYYGSDPGTIGGAQYDFMSVALHEVGHGHQLGHFATASEVMYWSISNGVTKRSVGGNGIPASNFITKRNNQTIGNAYFDNEISHVGHSGGSFTNNQCGPARMTPKTCSGLPSCFDGILNQTETGIDCGGTCAACPTCSDLIQNQNETSVDCGGICGGQPINDSICGAKNLNTAPGNCLTAENNNCTSPGYTLGCVTGNNMLWYKYDLPDNFDGFDFTISNSSSGGNFEIMVIGHKCTSTSVYGTDCGSAGTYSFTGLPEDSIYYIGVATTNLDRGTFNVCVVPTASPCVGGAPSYDVICSARPINGGTSIAPTAIPLGGKVCTALLQTNRCSTADFNDGGCIQAGSMSVWYSFQLTGVDNKVDITFDTNTFVGAQVGLMLLDSVCGDPNFVWSDCGNATTKTFSVTSLSPGVVYWLMVSTPQGNSGDFKICIDASSDPCVFAPNSRDSICQAGLAIVPFNGSGIACYNGQSNNCSFPDQSIGCIGANSNSVWYEFDLTSINSDIKIKFSNTNFPNDTVQVGIIEGNSCNDLTAWVYNDCIRASTDTISVKGLDSTKKYFVMVSTKVGNEGNFDMCIQQFIDPCFSGGAPVNDSICAAYVISTDSTCIGSQTNNCASPSTSIGGCFGAGNSTVWYRFTLASIGSNVIEVFLNNHNFEGDVNMILLGAPIGTPCANIRTVALNYGTICQNPDSTYRFEDLSPDNVYYLGVGSRSTQTGNFQICTKEGTKPPGTKTGPEQDCNAGIPVCNTTYTTSDAYVGFGTTEEVFGNCLQSGERNAVWYIVTVQQSGPFGFTLGSTPAVDYDFAMYDITETGCPGVTSMLPVRCNYCGTRATTGLDVLNPQPKIPETSEDAAPTCINTSEGINVVAGETYALVISNYTADNTGFTLTFTGASVYDTIPPQAWEAYADCGANAVIIETDEPVLCASIAATDFVVVNLDNGLNYTSSIINVTGEGCTGVLGQTTTRIILENDGSWPSGNYRITVNNGSILQDKCNNIIRPSGYMDFEYVAANIQVSLDKTILCAPGEAVVITATGLPVGEVYVLNPGGLANSTGIFKVYPTTTTTYTVTTTYAGCVINAQRGVQVIEEFITNVNPLNVTICNGTQNIEATSTINGQACNNCTYSWNNPVQNSGMVIKDTLFSVGDGYYTVTAYTPSGCPAQPATSRIRLASSGAGNACEVMYVTPTGTGTGLTKDDPTSLDSALARAICTNTVIKCAIGAYNYDKYFSVNSYITIEGGYYNNGAGPFSGKTSNIGNLATATVFTRNALSPDEGFPFDYSMFRVVGGSEGFRFQDLRIIMPTTHAVSSGKNNFGIKLGPGCTSYNIKRCMIDGGTGADQ